MTVSSGQGQPILLRCLPRFTSVLCLLGARWLPPSASSQLVGLRLQVKSLGVRKLLQLAKNDPTNLEEFIENEPLMGALSRVLHDDYKRSIELTLPLCTLFCIFSKFSDMHEILTKKAVGSMAIKIVELELSRYELRAKKMREYRKAVESGKKDQEFVDAEEQKTRDWVQKQESLLCMYVHSRVAASLCAFAPGNTTNCSFLAFVLRNRCIRMLLNMSEDVDVERKMAQKTDLLKDLVTLLARRNAELLKIVLVFLKKLCVVLENSIKVSGVLPELVALRTSNGWSTGKSDSHLHFLCAVAHLQPDAVDGLWYCQSCHGIHSLQGYRHRIQCAQTVIQLVVFASCASASSRARRRQKRCVLPCRWPHQNDGCQSVVQSVSRQCVLSCLRQLRLFDFGDQAVLDEQLLPGTN